MRHWANYSLETGRLLQVYGLIDDAEPFQMDGTAAIETPKIEATEARDYRVIDGVLVHDPIPPRPSEHHELDWQNKTWNLRLDLAKAAKHHEIEVERDHRITAPVIAYDGKTLDADAVSIDRLSKKLAAIAAYEMRGETMPTDMLFWRDYDNVTHFFASHEEYKNWLAGLAVALDVRGTLAFVWSIQKKAALQAAQTTEEIAAVTLDD